MTESADSMLASAGQFYCLPPTSVGGGRNSLPSSAGFSRAFVAQSRQTVPTAPFTGLPHWKRASGQPLGAGETHPP